MRCKPQNRRREMKCKRGLSIGKANNVGRGFMWYSWFRKEFAGVGDWATTPLLGRVNLNKSILQEYLVYISAL